MYIKQNHLLVKYLSI